jgi:tyrosine decarboxylase/aspartate 1-decarboxylase
LDKTIDPKILSKLLKLYSSVEKHYSGKILGSMTTYPHPLAIYAYLLFIHTNAADPIIFNELEYMRREIFEKLGKLYGCSGEGLVTSGGTESNILAIYVAKKTSKRNNNIVIAPDTVHVSIDKACSLIGCKLVKIPTNNRPLDTSLLEEYIRRYDPFAIVITAGTTERGLVDPIRDSARIAYEYNVYLHIDAAYGGLIIPFLYKHGYLHENLLFYKGVSSISIDFHKNGLTPIPSGVLLFSDRELYEYTCHEAKYTLHGKYCGLLGTRPGGSIASIWAMLELDEGFYEKLAIKMYKYAWLMYEKLSEFRELYVYKPVLPIIVFKHKYINSEILLRKLLEKKYYLYRAPSINGLRIVVMPHIELKHIESFINTLKIVLEEVKG